MADPTIGLRISGTKQRQAGFVPLVTCGILAGDEGKNMDRVTMVAEKPVYIIKHAPDYILYQLIDRQVKSFDADASGVLSIAMTIPSNMQLAQGKSPYRLLRDIYEKFQETCMERLSDGRDSFKNMDNDSDIFREIVGCYSLEERRTGYVVMNPQGLTGITCVSPDDLEAFFKNTQYKEFASFKDIEVGINCKDMVSAGLESLQIPLPQASYEVWVNNQPSGKTMQSYLDRYRVHSPGTKLYSYESVEFSLGEVMESNGNLEKNGALIHLDSKTNRIYCNLKKIEVSYELNFEWDDRTERGKNEILSLIKKGEMKVLIGSKDISQLLFEEMPCMKALDVNGQNIFFRPSTTSSYILQPQTEVDETQRKIVIRIVVTPRKQSTSFVSPPKQHVVNQTTPTGIHKPNRPITQSDEIETGRNTLPPSSPKKRFKSFLVGCIVGVIIGAIICFVGARMLGKSEGNGDSANPEDTTQTWLIGKWKARLLKIKDARKPNDAMKKGQENPVLTDQNNVASVPTRNKENDEQILAAEEIEKQAVEEAKRAKGEDNGKNRIATEQEILNMVKNHTKINQIKEVWGGLSKEYRDAIEAFYNINKIIYNGNINSTGIKKLEGIQKSEFSTLDQIVEARKEIKKVETDEYYKK